LYLQGKKEITQGKILGPERWTEEATSHLIFVSMYLRGAENQNISVRTVATL
jgi:hypothetical protein